MKKQLRNVFFLGSVLFLSASCTVSYINTDTLKQNYEKKIHRTTLPGKVLFKTDQRKKDTYEHVQVFLNENEVQRNFEVTAYGSYTPLILPIIRPERPRLEKYLLWKAARKARKLNADGVIIDNKNDFRVIKFK
ncbi:MAG: hypothetical protein IJ892_04110 [Prevotella sp.]|jgi:CO dehydrogenase/acetyl-CoA synthase beta subunit|nr:hypothetical protein [Prevotella sp.]